ncbi:hypothetical protein KUTeg_017058 [Tegillarca granosa]|uniref:SH2 domain-containing protein n=1 Tax=Tegillarca granosa TaxID=220873 RepID=A0ABQ9EMN3_TEGGR|nr:hypothetical protein KUTeg_017058 [Tegillarca granosa]
MPPINVGIKSVLRSPTLKNSEKSVCDEDWWFAKHTDAKYSNTKNEGFVPRNYVAKEDSMDAYEWFMGHLSRKESERLLLSPSREPGTFLVRESETSPGNFVLSVRDIHPEKGPTVKHYKIRNMDNNAGYYIAARRILSSLPELVDHYKSMSILKRNEN